MTSSQPVPLAPHDAAPSVSSLPSNAAPSSSSTSGTTKTSIGSGENGEGNLPVLPWAFIDCPIDILVILISHMLNLLIAHNDQVLLTPDSLTRFHSRAPPTISVVDYLRRIVKYTNMEPIPLLSLLAYIDTTCLNLPSFTLSSLTVHRFLIAGICVGSKAQCDVFCTNSHYARVGGIKMQELNGLEREFLRVTKWNLCCTPDLLQRYYSSLIRSHGGYIQAPPPAVSPFYAFPRSASKPSSPAGSTSSTSLEPEREEQHEIEIDHDMTEGNNGPSFGDIPQSSSSSISTSNSQTSPHIVSSTRARSKRSRHSDKAAKMDIDSPRADHISPASEASSSSIPSSRSSLRRVRSPRGRTLDTSTASASTNTSASSTSARPHSPAQRNLASTTTTMEGNSSSKGDHEHGRLLKKLVGGLFRRRSMADHLHIPNPSQHRSFEHGSHGVSSNSSDSFTTTHSHVSAHATNVTASETGQDRARRNAPPSPITAVAVGRTAMPPPPSTAGRVTPKIRTRDDRSVESLPERRMGFGPVGQDGRGHVSVGQHGEEFE
ncbi:hypothetical protein TREMEDRAFT_74329 [Tremella mesenterica DSM 1558]|uniref:uncharacterized protein n=1 Tax=Tremella mesenterica (strain ATCC 24925 / CBS 8224 / DSM 1558 / NBRC 9311 / NRRL Y-6157 / RJB 2259-6 / UBC 559-6) TaxID=578456 RepID=UPI0003F4A443|nr:uncharacterized protein TREMEDRAFT_74329 [Tremella mesenterica DSM 1558]EIW67858.1 hypothetical protein TREMEDRAFT_74329 [Tremella mesenterica DSM 1558]